MEFVFLNGLTGADLVLSRPSCEIAYHDGRHAHSALPSTAHEVEPGSPRSCGLLFLSDLYIQGLPQADQDLIAVSGGNEENWPRSLGRLPRPSTQPEPELEDDPLERDDMPGVAGMSPCSRCRQVA